MGKVKQSFGFSTDGMKSESCLGADKKYVGTSAGEMRRRSGRDYAWLSRESAVKLCGKAAVRRFPTERGGKKFPCRRRAT